MARAAPLLLLRPDPLDRLDLERRAAALFGDLAVLVAQEGAHRLVAVEAAKQLRGHTAVGALRAVFIEDVEEGEFAFGIGPGFFWHARLVPDRGKAVKANPAPLRAGLPCAIRRRNALEMRSDVVRRHVKMTTACGMSTVLLRQDR